MSRAAIFRTTGRLCFAACALLLTGCSEAWQMGLGLGDRAVGARFDAELAPALRDVCTAQETEMLRNITIDLAAALTWEDMETLASVPYRAQALAPQCLARYNALTCQRQKLDAAQGGGVPGGTC